MSGIPLKRQRSSAYDTDIDKCIICQKVVTDSTCSTPDGRKRLIEAAYIRQDDVSKRLETVDPEVFVYHVNNACYKSYTLNKTLLTIKVKQENDDEEDKPVEVDPQSSRSTRASVTTRAPPLMNSDIPVYKRKCIICTQVKYNNETNKYRMCEDERASKFLKAVVYFQDDVYYRTSDLQDVYSVFGADIFCHKNCIRRYLLRYDRAKINVDDSPSNAHKNEVFRRLISDIDLHLKDGEGFALSDLRTRIDEYMPTESDISFTNREIRLQLENYYGDGLKISLSNEVNKSAMVFLNVAPEDMADTIRSSDPIMQCASIIRQELLDFDFNLQDSFCDATDLQESWDNMEIPPGLLTFLAKLFNCDPNQFSKSDHDTTEMWGADNNENNGNIKSSPQRARKMQAMFQILYFIVNNGRRRTPLHLMSAESIHSTCKSYTLITALNHFGLCVSYDEIQRYQNDMAELVSGSADDVPLPSNFSPEKFTTAAFDNFDHEEATLSGIHGSHDTVSVLFQDKPTPLPKKPAISVTQVQHGPRVFRTTLPCQELKEFHKPARRGDIPEDYNADTMSSVSTVAQEERVKDHAWTLGRMDLSEIDNGIIQPQCDEQSMPSWSAFNSLTTSEHVPEKIVGFLPVLPYPVTDYTTVYTALTNFQCILGQLKQDKLAIACDEGVYRIAREIMLWRPNEFQHLVLCLGSFHMIKIYLGCIGKYIRDSGAESIWIENGIFGPNVTQAVLGGSHYVRSLAGMTLLSEAMERLQWEAFFDECGIVKYQGVLNILRGVKENVSEKNREESQQLLGEFAASSDTLFADFEEFKNQKSVRSETFRYWATFIDMVDLAKDLVRADREGNWPLHLETVQAVLPYFATFDSINYLRWSSLYLADMQSLPQTAPAIHENFLNGGFVVKRSSAPFTAVAMDMCLEQTINRSSKSSAGIIGSTRKKQYVTKWNIIHHEMMSINHLFREISGVRMDDSELVVNHEFTNAHTEGSEKKVNDMMAYIVAHENPFKVANDTEKRLHNILTSAIMPDEVRKDLMTIKESGVELYNEFRNDRIIDKTKRLSDVIHKRKLKTFASSIAQSKKPANIKHKHEKKNFGSAQKKLDIARVRGCDARYVFEHDIVASGSYLFDDDGFMKKPTKSELTKELEKELNIADYQRPLNWSAMPTAYFVDVMGHVRKIRTVSLTTFGDFCEVFMKMIIGLSVNASRIDFVFDSYIEGTVKDSERQRRTSRPPIEYSSLNLGTKLPKEMDSFWASSNNKASLEELLARFLVEQCPTRVPGVEIVCSQIEGEAVSTRTMSARSGITHEINELNSTLEEADVRIMPHILHAIRTGVKRIVVLSSDTDVLVLLLHFAHTLNTQGMVELWMRAGVGDTIRYIPVHVLARKQGRELCEVLPAVHALTGCDITSRFGTKAAALRANPVQHLHEFGRNSNNLCLVEAELYLVQVLKRGDHKIQTMTELRHNLYHHSKSVTILDLPPTSYAATGHILRAFHSTYSQINCLSALSLNATDFGFKSVDGLLVPDRFYLPLPDDVAIVCTCVKCSSTRNDETFWTTTGLFPQEFIMSFGHLMSLQRISMTCYNVRKLVIEKSTSDVNTFEQVTEMELPQTDGQLQTEEFNLQPNTEAVHLRFLIESGFDHFISVHKLNIEGNAVRGA